MKLYINKGQYGWYTTAKNRNDKEDKKYVGLFFPKNTEPQEGTECINPIEWALSCYKGNVGMTIFKYEIENNVQDSSKMGGSRSDSYSGVIEPSELPFY